MHKKSFPAIHLMHPIHDEANEKWFSEGSAKSVGIEDEECLN